MSRVNVTLALTMRFKLCNISLEHSKTNDCMFIDSISHTTFVCTTATDFTDFEFLFLISLILCSFVIFLGNVPCPVIYGAVVDSTCLFWEDNCGEPGACRLYDPEKFRMMFHGLTALIMLGAFFVDALVCYKASSVRFHDDEAPAEGRPPALPNNESAV